MKILEEIKDATKKKMRGRHVYLTNRGLGRNAGRET